MKPITLFVLAMLAIFPSINAQELKYELSDPIDISIAGTDKVLLMENGNTVLFHLNFAKASL